MVRWLWISLFLAGCPPVDQAGDDPREWDYKLDRLRVLAVHSDLGLFIAGEETKVDLLALGPRGEATDATWKICGLDPDRKAEIWGLGCFEDDVEVELLGTGKTLSWTPPLPSDPEICTLTRCQFQLPILIEAFDEEQSGLGLVWVGVWAPGVTSVHPVYPPLAVEIVDDGNGVVTVETGLPFEVEADSIFVWYVDDGELLDGGVTEVVTGPGTTTTRNRWRLPEEAGSYRIVAVASQSDTPDLTPYEYDDNLAIVDPGNRGGANMSWGILTVEVP